MLLALFWLLLPRHYSTTCSIVIGGCIHHPPFSTAIDLTHRCLLPCLCILVVCFSDVLFFVRYTHSHCGTHAQPIGRERNCNMTSKPAQYAPSTNLATHTHFRSLPTSYSPQQCTHALSSGSDGDVMVQKCRPNTYLILKHAQKQCSVRVQAGILEHC